MKRTLLAVLLVASSAACGAQSQPPATPATPPPTTTASQSLDANAIAQAAGAQKGDVAGNVVKVSFPRSDVAVEVDGWQKMPPFMGLTSWAAFQPGEKPGVEAMVMGDLVLFEDEVNDAMSAALSHGLQVTALHNHFFFDKPRVLFMHIEGEGKADDLAKAVAATLDAEKAVRKKNAQPQAQFGAPPPSPSKIDGAKLDAVFGIKGDAKDGMYKATMGRSAKAACGCAIGKVMGVNTWAAFGGTEDDAIVDGDFAVSEAELQPVLKALRGGSINIVAIHSHMTGETPRILFLHYWGRGPSAALAQTVKRAVDLTAWDRPQAP